MDCNVPIRVWRGEKALRDGCYAEKLTVEELAPEIYAYGNVAIKDYLKGGAACIYFWAAMSTGRGEWIVLKIKDKKKKIDASTDSYFTENDALNNDIVAFITMGIKEFIITNATMIGPERYRGPIQKYDGPCVCGQLASSAVMLSFPWEKITGKKFPQKCFECSCGTRWWCFNPVKHLWTKINNAAAWENLLIYNGAAIIWDRHQEAKSFL